MQLFEKLIEYPEAERLVLENAPKTPVVKLPLFEALGLLLAEDLVANFDSPPFDNSAVDGYAVRAGDTGENVELEVVDEAPAGRPSTKTVGSGEAIKIFTGGVIPDGADAVIMVEDTSGWSGEGSSVITIGKAVPEENNVRRGGEDVRAGQTILEAGVGIGPYETALAASQGYSRLPVHRRPKVVVLSTGTELVEPGSRELSPGEIFDSNSYAIVAQAREAGAEAVRLYAASDEYDVTRAALEEALSDADVVVTSGGVSVGERDLVKAAIEELGVEQVFWGVKFKPGKPLFFGSRGDSRFFGLPGNPVSAMVCFELFVRPALMKMMNRTDHRRPKVRVYFEEDFTNRFGRMHAVRVSLKRTEKGLLATSVGAQGSGLITSLTKADAIAIIGPEAHIKAGEMVEAVVLRDF
ncbi:gephyrin-like molybdotransferase Glp [Rubrobacter indicoceani]|uniref:molybdopterin molybdotransferase MoeA n=1 Tax=Rubrobacter indicoceani TaxID=2051957 RepID=UPI000E5A764F|nr:gephyrin-like molybdotransferase Glp [Rubrobacter indicoceani]